MDKKIKILVGYHKPASLIKSEIFEPIHLGRDLATDISKDGKMSQEDYQWMLDNMIGDNTGDNISNLNRQLCELTGLYWAWKNYEKLGNPDYVGFMHYRRLLSFSPDSLDVCNGEIREAFLDEHSLKKHHINEEAIKREVLSADIVFGKQVKLSKNVYEQFQDLEIPKYGLDSKIFYDALKISREDFPEYSEAIDIYSQSKLHYWYNCFVMKKEYFYELCNFLFHVLLKIQPMIDYSRYNLNGQRVLGYVAERLIGVYITNLLLKEKNFSIKYLPIIFFNNTEISLPISPRERDQKTVVFSVDNNYIPYLAVTIKSLINNVSSINNYVIYVLESEVSDCNKRKIKLMETDNVKIEFVSIDRYIRNFDSSIFYLCDHFSISTYFRFFIPQIFKNFDKLLYCDCDAIFLKDPAELFDIDLKEHWLGVVHDTEAVKQIFINKKDTYYTEKLKLKVPQNYFQAGFLLMNIPQLLEVDFEKRCIDKLKEIKTPRYVDQCILNSVCEDNVLFLDASWNVENHLMLFDKDISINLLPQKFYVEYLEAIQSPKFLHFSGCKKPWQDPASYNAHLFWEYARKTIFYEEIIYRNQTIFSNLGLLPKKKFYKNFLQRIFSIKNFEANNKSFKVVTILGIKIKKVRGF